MTFCILTPDATYSERWHPAAEAFSRLLGDRLVFRPWTEPGDLSGVSLILPLIAWGYPEQTQAWFEALDAWEASGLPFANPVATLRWNTDKDYLFDLEAAGVPIVPTIETAALVADDLTAARAQFSTADLVIKPSISAGALGTYRLRAGDAIPFDVLETDMLIQPVMPAIMDEGEYSLFHFGGRFSHAILKSPAAGDFRVQPQYGGHEVPVTAPAPACALAEAAIACAPAAPLYARTDVVRDADGAFRIMELELIEPALFLDLAPDKGAAFAAAVSRWTA